MPAALQRFADLPAFANRSPPTAPVTDLALHDAQSVIAREHGFASWNALREEVEARTLSFDAAVEEFVRCATGGASGRAERLLALHPRIATASLHTALVLGDAAAVDAQLQAHPELATQPGGPQHWEPLLYVCHTCMHRDAPGASRRTRRDCAAAVRAWRESKRRVSLELASGTAAHRALGRALRGAASAAGGGAARRGRQSDRRRVRHIAGGRGDVAALELLHRFGVNVNGIPGGVPPLVYMMAVGDQSGRPALAPRTRRRSESRVGRRGEAPLHVAARRWDVAMVELLVRHGADPMRRRTDGRTPHTLAELHGNHDIAERLLAHGARTSFRRSNDSSPRARAAIAPAAERCSRLIRACAPNFVPNTT